MSHFRLELGYRFEGSEIIGETYAMALENGHILVYEGPVGGRKAPRGGFKLAMSRGDQFGVTTPKSGVGIFLYFYTLWC